MIRLVDLIPALLELIVCLELAPMKLRVEISFTRNPAKLVSTVRAQVPPLKVVDYVRKDLYVQRKLPRRYRPLKEPTRS